MSSRQASAGAVLLFCLTVQAWAEATIVVPTSFRAYRLDAVGASELEPEWTAAARTNLDAAMADILNRAAGFDIREFPDLSDDERTIVDEHVALFEANALAAYEMIEQAGIEAKRLDPAYTVGTGLAFLAERGIADRAVVVTGSQSWSTGGRKFLMVLGAAAGAYVPGGSSGLLVGYIDLRSGTITWMNYLIPVTGGDVREADRTAAILRKLTDQYPDSKLYEAKTP